MKPKLIIFDFWKTLVYSPNKDPHQFYSGLKNFNIEIKEKERERFSHFFSKGMCLSKSWLDFSEKLLKEFSTNQTEKNIKAFSDFLKKIGEFKFYDDIKEVNSLPYKKIVLTDSGRFLIKPLEKLDYFSRIFTPQDTGGLKPDPKVFSVVMKEMDARLEETIMIGDDPERDVKPAENLGMKTILIDRKNKHPEYIKPKIKSFRELKTAIEGL